MKKLCATFCKHFHWKYLVLASILSVVFAVVNNLRQPEERKVEWIGGQEVLPAPEEGTP